MKWILYREHLHNHLQVIKAAWKWKCKATKEIRV